jgi:hypothetical protein
VIEASRTATQAELVVVASRDAGWARAFAGELGLAASFGSYDELLASEAAGRRYIEGLMHRHHPRPALPGSCSPATALR